ncbi:MAG: S8 family serine peptidase [Candidatus Dojkabacteria bacterium]
MKYCELTKLKNTPSKVISLLFIVLILLPAFHSRTLSAQDGVVSLPVSTNEPIATDLAPRQIPEDLESNLQERYRDFGEEKVNNAVEKVKKAIAEESKNDFFIVKFNDEESANRVTQEVAPENTVPSRFTKFFGEDVRLIKIDKDQDGEDKKIDQMTRFNLDDSVEYIETDQIVKKDSWTVTGSTAKPNDFNNTNHWFHTKTKLPEAFKDQGCPSGTLCGGSSTLTVAVLDTGLAFETNTGATYRENLGGGTFADRTPLNFTAAPEINGINIWTNSLENYTGHDDDANLICDDLHGVDFIAVVDNLALIPTDAEWNADCDAQVSWVTKEGHPNDDDGHGTYVTNMITSLTDNGTSSFGAAFKTTIMPIKVLDYTGTGTTFTIAQGIRYAANHGAKVINLSIAGLTSPSATVESAISYANGLGVLLVAASGNQNLSSIEYPAAYTNSYGNVIAVGATNTSDTKADYASYGTGLDLVAPVGNASGSGVAGSAAYAQTFQDADSWSVTPVTSRSFTTFGNKFWEGTSFAAPQVTAVAVMLRAKSDSLAPVDVKTILRSSANGSVGSGGGLDLDTGYGLLDAQNALNSVSQYSWSSWQRNGGTPYDVAMATTTFGGTERVYQAVTGYDSRVYIRYSTDGNTWQPWVSSGSSLITPTLAYFNNGSQDFLFEVVQGVDGRVWTRYTTDGDTWQPWVNDGGTAGKISMAAYGTSRLYQTVRGGDNNVWNRYFDGAAWQAWSKDGGTTPGEISMASFDPSGPTGNRLYQAVRGFEGAVWTRYFDGSSWQPWIRDGGTPSNPTLSVFNARIYQSVRGWDNHIWTRYSTDGNTWQSWVMDGGTTPYEVSMQSFSTIKLFQSVRGFDNAVWTRYTTDGNTWQPWVKNITMASNITMAYMSSKLFQAVRTSDGAVNTRYYYE